MRNERLVRRATDAARTWTRRAALAALTLGAAVAASWGGADGARADDPAADGAESWDDVPVLRLHDAVADGTVSASGAKPTSYRRVVLSVRNRLGKRVAVDIAGSHLVPERGGSCQRLGLGPAVTASDTGRRGDGSVVVTLEPGQERSLEVNTCCLDSSLPAPSSQRFVGSRAKLPPVREKVLRWWADHPAVAQGDVNHAIWTNAPEVRVTPGSAAERGPPRLAAAIHRGTYYRLVDGELTATGEDGILRILGTRVDRVFPGDEGVFAVAPGSDGSPKLWLLPMTGADAWTKVLDLESGSVREILPAGRGRFAVLTESGLDWYRGPGTAPRRVLHAPATEPQRMTVRRSSDRELLVTSWTPPRKPIVSDGEQKFASAAVCELWSVSLETGKEKLEERFWNVDSIWAGAGGVHALSHVQGELRRLHRGRLEHLTSGREWSRVAASTKAVLWLVGEGGLLTGADPRTGDVTVRTRIAADAASELRADPETGDLAYVRDGKFHRVRGADGADETLPDRDAAAR